MFRAGDKTRFFYFDVRFYPKEKKETRRGKSDSPVCEFFLQIINLLFASIFVRPEGRVDSLLIDSACDVTREDLSRGLTS